jgi:hypothetical protein
MFVFEKLISTITIHYNDDGHKYGNIFFKRQFMLVRCHSNSLLEQRRVFKHKVMLEEK